MRPLAISSVANGGDYQRERVVLRANEDHDIGRHLMLCAPVQPDGELYGGRKTSFWFPDTEVKKDDLVVLYSRMGEPGKKDLSDNRKAHFFYWGLDQCVWGGGNKPVLIQARAWSTLESDRDEIEGQ